MSVTADEVKAYRDKHGVGMLDATRTLKKQDRAERLADVENIARAATDLDIEALRQTIIALAEIVAEMNE